MSAEIQWALEVEYPLADLEGNLLFIEQLDWRRLNEALNAASAVEQDHWVPKYPGHRASPFYLEGFDIYDSSDKEVTSLQVKGIEIRTDIHATIPACLRNLVELFTLAGKALQPLGCVPVILGGHPTAPSFQERQSMRSFADWKAAEVTMTTAGIHVNISIPEELFGKLNFEAARARTNYLAPALALFSMNSPFLHGEPWKVPGGAVGKSSRSFLRAFYREPLRAKPGKFGTRFHFSLYDSVPSLERIAALMELSLGILLSNRSYVVIADTVRTHNIVEAARYGFAARFFDGNRDIGSVGDLSLEVLGEAQESLSKAGFHSHYLQSLRTVSQTKQLYSDELLATWEKNKSFSAIVESHRRYPEDPL